MSASEKIILALDISEYGYALDLVDRFGEYVGIFKIGLELFTACGPKIVDEISGKRGRKVFLDLKFHDIPNTVSKAAIASARLGIYMFSVHTSGGLEMMRRCRESVTEVCLKEGIERPRILGVSVLTSLTGDALRNELGVRYAVRSQVKHLSALALSAGLDGVVASGQEVGVIRRHCGGQFLIVTPGIRPSWRPPDDQKRTMTPKEAIRAGADYIVVGRTVTQQPDPLKALELVSLEMISS
jgi:orotidine-5'-phosphate decarboxylase